MKPSELADYIITIHEGLKIMDEDLKKPTIDGGMYRLMLERIDEWEMYKVYCLWTRKELQDQEATKAYIELTDKIQENIDETQAARRDGTQSDRIRKIFN